MRWFHRRTRRLCRASRRIRRCSFAPPVDGADAHAVALGDEPLRQRRAPRLETLCHRRSSLVANYRDQLCTRLRARGKSPFSNCAGRGALRNAFKCLICGAAIAGRFTANALKTAVFVWSAKPCTPVQFRAWPPPSCEHTRVRSRGGTKNRDDASSHRNRGLTVLQIAIFTRSHGWIFGLAPRGNTFDQSVVVGLLKEGD